MTSMKRSLLFSVMAFCSFSVLAKDAYIYFTYSQDIPESDRHSYTIKPGGSSKGMYGVYNPGEAHLSKYAANVDWRYHTPHDYIRVHWKSSGHQSYQDFFVTDDDDPSVKAKFRWYKPYFEQAYITVFSGDLGDRKLYFERNWKFKSNDTLLYVK